MTAARIEQLTLHQVRSYDDLNLALDPGVTVLVGANGEGKTNLLEACAVALAGASPRTTSEQRLIRAGADAARVAARVRVGDAVHQRDVVLRAGVGKQLRVDGSPVASVDAYAQDAPVATFLPEKLLTIRGAPLRRRALVDQLARRVIPGAACAQRDYQAALQQRNAVLRRAKTGRDVQAELQPWTEQLLEHGVCLRAVRAELLAELADPYEDRFAQLTAITGATFEAQARGSGELVADLAEVAAAELRRGTTLAGPHLDDVLARVPDRDLRAFGSTGEQRAALLAFTLATRDLLARHAGMDPVVLLDEPWSELDADRRRRLTHAIATLGQVVVTSTEAPAHLRKTIPDARVLQVSCGQVTACPTPTPATD